MCSGCSYRIAIYIIGTLPCAVEGMWRVGTGEFLNSGGAGAGAGTAAPDVTGAVIAVVIVAADVDEAVVVITCCVSVEYTSHCQAPVSSNE